jgi:tetratricopeptide (TPR) repeat protein
VGGDYNALDQLGAPWSTPPGRSSCVTISAEREKSSIIAAYYRNVTRELDKAAQTYQEQIDNYPGEP